MSSNISFNPDDNTFEGTRRVRTSGGSTIVTIPPQILDATRLQPNDQVKLVCKIEDEEFCISKVGDDQDEADVRD